MKRKHVLFSLLALSSIALSGCYVDLGFIKLGKAPEEETASEEGGNKPAPIDGKVIKDSDAYYDAAADAERISTYYSGFNDSRSGSALLTAIRSLNSLKRTKEVGYELMGTSSSGYFKFTDFSVKSTIDYVDGIPFGTKVSSFYSGKSAYTFNREHVWPESHGGESVEDDIFMTRPTIEEENSDRGNSAYVTGMVTEHSGWDPVAAFAQSLGVYQSVRGECARIIFYCMTATSTLSLVDSNSLSSSSMGKLTDLVVWSCENPVTYREKRRNVGGQYLQGNRNTFVDHPEYVCKIWGDTNSTTKSACSKAGFATN